MVVDHSYVPPQWRRLLLFMLGAACTVVVIAGIRSADGMLNPVLVAAFLALLLQPLVRDLAFGPAEGSTPVRPELAALDQSVDAAEPLHPISGKSRAHDHTAASPTGPQSSGGW